MARKKEPTWITGKVAAKLLTEKVGDQERRINERYIRRMAAIGKVDSKPITPRLTLYSKEDVLACTVGERVGRSKKTA